MRKPCVSCSGRKISSKPISRVLKLGNFGATAKQAVNSKTAENTAVLTVENSPSPRFSPSPILAFSNKEYKHIGKLEFPSRKSV